MDSKYFVSIGEINLAAQNVKDVALKSPLEKNYRLSSKYNSNIYLKREDLQIVRSYKIRGAYNLICKLSASEKEKGIITASAGNHAQGVAFSANKLKIPAIIYMPLITPIQKINKVKKFGGKYVEIKIVGNNFDESNKLAVDESIKTNKTFIPPFDDDLIIAGQGTVAKELLEQTSHSIDYLVVPIGGGGLIAGIISYFKIKSPNTKIIGVEPAGAEAMSESIKKNRLVNLQKIDTFVDGAAVKKVGQKTFNITKGNVDRIIIVSPNQLSHEMIELYQEDGVIAEPAGALAVTALNSIKEEIKEKMVVCIVSGGNNDVHRYQDIIDKSLKHQGLKHHYQIKGLKSLENFEKYLNKNFGEEIKLMIEDIDYNNSSFNFSISYKNKDQIKIIEKYLSKI